MELLEICTDSTLPCIMTKLEPFIHHSLRLHIVSAGLMDSMLVSITHFPYACGQVAPRISVATELAFPCLIPNLLLMCFIYSLSTQSFAPSVWTMYFFRQLAPTMPLVFCIKWLLGFVINPFISMTSPVKKRLWSSKLLPYADDILVSNDSVLTTSFIHHFFTILI